MKGRLLASAEEVGHELYVLVAGVIQIRETEAGFDRLEQREVVVQHVAGDAGWGIAGVDNGDDLVGQAAVVVFVPNGHDDVVAFFPHLRGLDAGDERLDRRVALRDVVGIDRASGADFSAAATVHVVALVGDDEGKVRNAVVGQVDVELVQVYSVLQAVVGVLPGLNAREVDEWIVLDGVKVGHARCGFSEIGKKAVAVVDAVCAVGGKALLIALPAHVHFIQLIGDAHADGLCGIDGGVVDRLGRSAFVGCVDGGRCGVKASASDGAGVGGGGLECGLAQFEVRHARGVVPIR